MALSRIVVGVDNSTESDDALVWGLDTGRLRGLPVRAANVWSPSAPPEELDKNATLPPEADIQTYLQQQVAAAVGRAAERVTGADVSVTSEILYGHPARELIQAAGTDSLLVVGSRGRGRVAGSMLGSVSQSIAQLAASTVVVVHGGQREPRAGRVVVGVDGSSPSVQALQFADVEAHLRGASLLVVCAWTAPLVGLSGRSGVSRSAIEESARRASKMLLDTLRLGSVDEARSDVEMWLVEGLPAVSLLEAANFADLLVVGSRGYGGWKGLLMGSVSSQCVTQSPCPVAVVRHDHDNADLVEGASETI